MKHGAARRGMKRPGEYNSWAQMHSRCRNPKVPEYAHYGARGIVVCERWSLFETFLADMGARPVGYSIERADINGHYEPGNCRWASNHDQARNTTRNVIITIGGRTQVLADWVLEMGKNKSTVAVRIHRGMAPIEALLKP